MTMAKATLFLIPIIPQNKCFFLHQNTFFYFFRLTFLKIAFFTRIFHIFYVNFFYIFYKKKVDSFHFCHHKPSVAIQVIKKNKN